MSRTHTHTKLSSGQKAVFTNPNRTSWFMGLKFVFPLPDHKDIVNISEIY